MAAGLGFKDFQTGEVLTAADVDGYLMQGIWVFASTAARDAAVTSPSEGNFAFTKDTNSLWYYDGAAWVASGATGDIEGVTAGIGISGGGTSGTVTVTNSMATAIDAKGDLVVGTGADTFSKLTVGANGTTLVADSSTATGLKWDTPAAGSRYYAVFQDEKSATTAGGSFTSGAWRTRDLNTTKINNITGASLASNQVTLAAGTYYVNASMPAYGVYRYSGRLQNITDSTTPLIATTGFSNASAPSNAFVFITGQFTISAQKTFEVQSRCSDTKNGDGYGVAGEQMGDTQNSVFSVISIEKIG
jgi:hypothetical protein